MKKTIISSKVVKRAVKTLLVEVCVIGFFVYMKITHLYDVIFLIAFSVLNYKFFAISD